MNRLKGVVFFSYGRPSIFQGVGGGEGSICTSAGLKIVPSFCNPALNKSFFTSLSEYRCFMRKINYPNQDDG